jgi:hypothetical protein
MRCRRPLIPSLVLAAAAAAVLVAGCGGASQPTSSAGQTGKPSDPAADVLAFANCMHSHGLPSYPVPQISESADHVLVRISPGTLDANSPEFKSASRVCGHFLPGGTAPARPSPQDQVLDLRFAACMRTHGIPSFPDPDHDGVFTLPDAIDQQSPQFQRATKACASVEPSSLSILNQPPGNS